MAKGKVVQEVKGKVEDKKGLNPVQEEKKGKVEDKKGLNPVQEEGLRRAFTRKAILSPRYSFWTMLF